jgi:inner membrane protein
MVLAPRHVPRYFWSLSIACSAIADVDLIGFLSGVPYDHFFGHRGFFHSLFFGLVVSIAATGFMVSQAKKASRGWVPYFTFFFLLSASHGLLDALSNGSIGVALLSPFDTTRYFFPWQPLSMIRIRVFLRTWSFAAIKSELLWIWLPSLFIILVSLTIRRVAKRRGANA